MPVPALMLLVFLAGSTLVDSWIDVSAASIGHEVTPQNHRHDSDAAALPPIVELRLPLNDLPVPVLTSGACAGAQPPPPKLRRWLARAPFHRLRRHA